MVKYDFVVNGTRLRIKIDWNYAHYGWWWEVQDEEGVVLDKAERMADGLYDTIGQAFIKAYNVAGGS